MRVIIGGVEESEGAHLVNPDIDNPDIDGGTVAANEYNLVTHLGEIVVHNGDVLTN